MTTNTRPGTDIECGAAKPRPRVVIVGAGFGGLEAARALSRLPVDITIIDANNHHCFQPLLYQVATAQLSPADIAWPIRGMFRKQPNVRVVLGTVTGIDSAARIVRSDAGDIAYDYLILATGATHFYFGHPEWEAAAPGLKRIEDATRIRRRILLALERAEISNDEAGAPASDDLRDRRRRPDRSGDGRRHRGDRDAHAEVGFPPHRSAPVAHPVDRSRASHPAPRSRRSCPTTRARRWRKPASRSGPARR